MTNREKALAYFRNREAQTPMPGARAMYQEAIKALEQPEIIRCKDCIHWKHSTVRKSYCDVFDWMNRAEDFCSFAEREQDANND